MRKKQLHLKVVCQYERAKVTINNANSIWEKREKLCKYDKYKEFDLMYMCRECEFKNRCEKTNLKATLVYTYVDVSY